ncbi:MAG: C39 family peptidase, partial [Lachnospiraceae bacterium]|nr:C39 family peptidase [Lachnospiraceae bacterium]
MELRNVLFLIAKGVVFVVVVFIGLIAIDYFFAPCWLTDVVAFTILVLSFVACVLLNIRKTKDSPKNEQRHQRKTRFEESKKYRRKRKKPHRMRVQTIIFILCGVVIGRIGCSFIGKQMLHEVPENVIEFGEKYPEASGYVKNFNKYKDMEFDMDVSSEMEEREIPLFIQWDKRWGYKDYGGNYVGVAGCGPTCLAMVVCGLKQDGSINPYVVSQYSAEQGFYIYGQGTSWNIMTTGANHYGLEVSEGSVSADYILNNLSASSPMICSMSPGDFTTSGH